MDVITPPFFIEQMEFGDIAEVVALEQAAYETNWSRKDYAYELEQNEFATYFVFRLPRRANLIVGQAGFWLIADQIHINTIAVHPQWRRVGVAERLLLKMIGQGNHLGATEATLEVRVSNQTAQSLYRKYGFQQVGRRPRYYSNGEDGFILTTPMLTSPAYHSLLQQHQVALAQRLPQLIDKL